MIGAAIFLEVDEKQHKFGYGGVGCDMKRMSRIMESMALEGNTLPLVFIRYNPDVYKVDGKKIEKTKGKREEALVELLKSSVCSPTQPLTVQYMFYDVEDGETLISKEADYNEQIKECCVLPIV